MDGKDERVREGHALTLKGMCHKLHTPFCAQSIGKERNPVAAPTARRLGNVVLVWLGMCCAVLSHSAASDSLRHHGL